MRAVTLIAGADLGTQRLASGVSVEVSDDQAAKWEAEGKVAPSEKPAAKAPPVAKAASKPA